MQYCLTRILKDCQAPHATLMTGLEGQAAIKIAYLPQSPLAAAPMQSAAQKECLADLEQQLPLLVLKCPPATERTQPTTPGTCRYGGAPVQQGNASNVVCLPH